MPTTGGEHVDEYSYDRLRLAQWRAGRARNGGLTRRDVMRRSAGMGPAVAGGLASTVAGGGPAAAAGPAADAGPILKPLPPELFTVYGSNAEMRWEAMRGHGYLVPVDRFFVRNHTRTP